MIFLSLRQTLTIVAVAGSAVLLVAGCRGSGASTSPVISIEPEVLPQPVRVGPATIILNVADASRKPLTGARINLEGIMSHPGMAPSFGKASETAPGRYQAPLEFTMAGDWIIVVHLTLGDGRQVEKQFEVKGVRSD